MSFRDAAWATSPLQDEEKPRHSERAEDTLLSASSNTPTFPSISSTSSTTSSYSSSSIVLPLSPPLPPNTELWCVLTDTRLTLDVYQAGAAALPVLWRLVPGQLQSLQYLRLGSEDKRGLEDALTVVPHLPRLSSLAVRGTTNITKSKQAEKVVALKDNPFSLCYT